MDQAKLVKLPRFLRRLAAACLLPGLPARAQVPPILSYQGRIANLADVRLRVWFDDGVDGSQLLTPDQRFAPAGYAMGVTGGAITAAKLAPGAVGAGQLAPGFTLGGTTTINNSILPATSGAGAGVIS